MVNCRRGCLRDRIWLLFDIYYEFNSEGRRRKRSLICWDMWLIVDVYYKQFRHIQWGTWIIVDVRYRQFRHMGLGSGSSSMCDKELSYCENATG